MKKCKISFAVLFVIFSISFAMIASASSINGRVYDDANCNGQRNGGESGLSGITITLNPGSVTTSTNPGGNYNFPGLSAGIYTVTITVPPTYCSTTPIIKTIIIKSKDINNQFFGISKLPVSPGGESCCPLPL